MIHLSPTCMPNQLPVLVSLPCHISQSRAVDLQGATTDEQAEKPAWMSAEDGANAGAKEGIALDSSPPVSAQGFGRAFLGSATHYLYKPALALHAAVVVYLNPIIVHLIHPELFCAARRWSTPTAQRSQNPSLSRRPSRSSSWRRRP